MQNVTINISNESAGGGSPQVFAQLFFKKLAVSKGRAFGRSNERNGGCGGGSPRPSIVQKSFLSNFFQKKFEQTQFAELKLWIYK